MRKILRKQKYPKKQTFLFDKTPKMPIRLSTNHTKYFKESTVESKYIIKSRECVSTLLCKLGPVTNNRFVSLLKFWFLKMLLFAINKIFFCLFRRHISIILHRYSYLCSHIFTVYYNSQFFDTIFLTLGRIENLIIVHLKIPFFNA